MFSILATYWHQVKHESPVLIHDIIAKWHENHVLHKNPSQIMFISALILYNKIKINYLVVDEVIEN